MEGPLRESGYYALDGKISSVHSVQQFMDSKNFRYPPIAPISIVADCPHIK